VDLTERELRWLDEQLAQSKATWKIVYGHYQIYSASRGDNDEEQEDLIHRLLPILKKRGADLYICGHDHNLQILKADGGVNFVVAGGGGAGLYDFEQEEYTRSVFKAKAYGFAVIEADRTNLNVRLVNAEGKELSALKLKK
jgi:3',5'-cyclic AMP phosphodiesterase CpdA